MQLQKELGDSHQIDDSPTQQEVWRKYVDICQDALLDNDEAIHYLRSERQFTAASIAKYQLGYVPADIMDRMLEHFTFKEVKEAGLVTDKNHPVFFDRILIPYKVRDRFVTLRAKRVGDNVLQLSGSSIQLYSPDNLRGQQSVYICEGEFDAIYLDQLGYSTCAIPGALSWQDKWASWFDEAREVFIVLDADEAGFKGAQKIKDSLGFKAKIVELPAPPSSKSTDVTEYFLRDGHTKAEFDLLVDSSRDRNLYTISESLSERDRLLAEKGGVATGIRQLDYAVQPGFLPGQVAVVLAKSGQGKTAFLGQLIHNMSSWTSLDKSVGGEGVPTLVVSLEQTKAEFAHRLDRIAKLFNPWADRDELARWHSLLRINDRNRVPPEFLERLLEEYVDDVGLRPKVVMIDYLGYWSRAFKGKSKYEQVTEAILELKAIAKEQEIVVVAPHQVNRLAKLGERFDMDVARDAGTIEETADFAFALYRTTKPDEADNDELHYRARGEVRLEFLKSRHGNVGKVVSFLWGPYSLSLTPAGSQWEDKVKKEWQLYDKQYSYDEAVEVIQGKKIVDLR